MTRVRAGFVGLGNMGAPMAARVAGAGHELVVHDLDPQRVGALVDAGARAAPDLAEVARSCAVVTLSLPGPAQVRHVVLGSDGLLAAARPGLVIADATTSSLDAVREVAVACAARGVHYLDAPVSGGSKGAEAGTLLVMVGGDGDAVETARPVLESYGDPVLHLGASGAGTVMKLVNNQVFLCGEVVFQEGLVLAAKAGLDPATVMAVLTRTGAGGAHTANGDRVVGRQFDGPGFALALAEKDVALAIATGRELDVPMPASSAAHAAFVAALAAGLGHQRSFATLQVVESAAGTEVPAVAPEEA